MKPVIEVKNIGKSYQIKHTSSPSYSTLKDDFSRLLRGDRKAANVEKFWALHDISFDVMPGEVFGIIGHNGSGKSTLLKILSRIVSPDSGKAILHGKTASLLEVGTGFHPELTGRENIYFNGSMLGMSKAEIALKFNEIVEFSEIENFLDTPVKFYSSGMYVRLAFSVAAHLDPDILILDEVLSVGDASFQKKSLEKMTSIASSGKTIIYVSHGLGSVEKLCERVMLLDHGKVKMIGDSSLVADEYLKLVIPEDTSFIDVDSNKKHGSNIKTISKTVRGFMNSYKHSGGAYSIDDRSRLVRSVKTANKNGRVTTNFRQGDSIRLIIETNEIKCGDFSVEIRVKDEELRPVGYLSSIASSNTYFNAGDILTVDITEPNLIEGIYCLDIICRKPGEYHVENLWDTVGINVIRGQKGGYAQPIQYKDALGSTVFNGRFEKNA